MDTKNKKGVTASVSKKAGNAGAIVLVLIAIIVMAVIAYRSMSKTSGPTQASETFGSEVLGNISSQEDVAKKVAPETNPFKTAEANPFKTVYKNPFGNK